MKLEADTPILLEGLRLLCQFPTCPSSPDHLMSHALQQKQNKICGAQEAPVGPHSQVYSQVGQPIPAVVSLPPSLGIPPGEGLPFMIQPHKDLVCTWREWEMHPLLFKVILDDQGEDTGSGKQLCPGSCIG